MEHFEIFLAPQRDPAVATVSIKYGTNLKMYLGGAQQDIYILYECSKYTGCFQRLGRAIALKPQNIGKRFSLGKFERFRVMSHVAHVFFRKWRRFKDFEIISIFLYVVLHTIRRISSFSAKMYRLQSMVKVSMKQTIGDLLVLLLRFGENREKRNKNLFFSYLFTSIYSSCHQLLLLFIIIYY